MNTNWPDVILAFIFGLILVSGLAIGAWLVIQDHPWFAFFVMLIVASIKFKTGG